MADRVQQQLEDMVPELQSLIALDLFTEREVKEIIEKRRAFEFSILSTDPRISMDSFMDYIKYEIELDKVLQRRYRIRMRSPGLQRKKLKKKLKTDKEKRMIPIKVTIRRRVHRIFKRCLRRFISAVDIWRSYCEFCNSVGASKVMERAIMAALSKNPSSEVLWQIAAKFTLNSRGIVATKNVVQRALRTNPISLSLFILLLEVEVLESYRRFVDSFAEPLSLPAEGAEDDNLKVGTERWTIIFKHGLDRLQGDDVFRFLFFGVSLSSNVKNNREFVKSLGTGYDNFLELVFNEMFNRRGEYPLLGLYVWQHRLLESLLLKKYLDTETAQNPAKIWSMIVNDSKEHPKMSRHFSRFMDMILSAEDFDVGRSVVSQESNFGSDDLFEIDIQGDDVTEKLGVNLENEDTQEEPDYGVGCLLEICLLKKASPDFDEKCKECKYSGKITTRDQLLAVSRLFRGFFWDLVENMQQCLKKSFGEMPVHSLGDSEAELEFFERLRQLGDGFLDFIMPQVSILFGTAVNAQGYKLLADILSRIEKDDLARIILEKLLYSFTSSFCSTLERNSDVEICMVLMESPQVEARFKFEILRRAKSLMFSDKQLFSCLDSLQAISLELLLSLLSKSRIPECGPTEKIMEFCELIMQRVRKKNPELLEELIELFSSRKIRKLVGFERCAVALSVWFANFLAEDLKDRISSLEDWPLPSTEITRMKSEISRIFVLCEVSVEIAETIEDDGISKICWQRYIQKSKELEEICQRMRICDLYTMGISTDSIASRALRIFN